MSCFLEVSLLLYFILLLLLPQLRSSGSLLFATEYILLRVTASIPSWGHVATVLAVKWNKVTSLRRISPLNMDRGTHNVSAVLTWSNGPAPIFLEVNQSLKLGTDLLDNHIWDLKHKNPSASGRSDGARFVSGLSCSLGERRRVGEGGQRA